MTDIFFSQSGSEAFAGILNDTKREYADNGCFFLDKNYIERIDSDFHAFPQILEIVYNAAENLKKDSSAAFYALFVNRCMENRRLFIDNLGLFIFPENHSMLPFLCFLPFFEPMHKALCERKLPEDIIFHTLNQFEDCVFLFEKRFGFPGLNKRYFDFLQRYVDCRILNISRLRFEIMNLEDQVFLIRGRNGMPYAAAAESPGEEVLVRPGDCCLSVHIPDHGDFSADSCHRSYKRALEVFKLHFPELDIKAFHCESWMLSPELEAHLKSSSRILAFAKDYTRYPVASEGKDVLNFVFLMKGLDNFENLPEDTSLQRSLKQLYLSGGKIHEYGGLIPV